MAFGYSFIAFYETPLPGIGVSFSNLITDERASRAFSRRHSTTSIAISTNCPSASCSPIPGPSRESHLLGRAHHHCLRQRDSLAVMPSVDRQRRLCAFRPIFVPFFIVEDGLAVLGLAEIVHHHSFIPVVRLRS